MIYFPTCKLNLGLQVLSKREDGYHEIASVMLELPFHDILEITPSKDFNFELTGVEWNEDLSSNSCVKAFQLLKRHNPHLNNYSMHLHKCIPTGAGLGGGSSDASFVLRALNELEELNYSTNELEQFAAELGSDNAFFIQGGIQYSFGRGEKLEVLDKHLLDGYWIYLVNFGYHISTAEAYSGVQPVANRSDLKDILQQPILNWKETLHNDFELSVFKNYPFLSEAKNQLYKHGAIYAAMSGSGSTMFGIFEKEQEIPWERPFQLEKWLKL